MEIKLSDALDLIRGGVATYTGTTHTEHFGFWAIIERHDLSRVDHVADVGPEDIEALEAAQLAATA